MREGLDLAVGDIIAFQSTAAGGIVYQPAVGVEVIITHTAEKALEKLYTRHGNMKLVEQNVNQYIMNLNEDKYKNLDWISK